MPGKPVPLPSTQRRASRARQPHAGCFWAERVGESWARACTPDVAVVQAHRPAQPHPQRGVVELPALQHQQQVVQHHLPTCMHRPARSGRRRVSGAPAAAACQEAIDGPHRPRHIPFQSRQLCALVALAATTADCLLMRGCGAWLVPAKGRQEGGQGDACARTDLHLGVRHIGLPSLWWPTWQNTRHEGEAGKGESHLHLGVRHVGVGDGRQRVLKVRRAQQAACGHGGKHAVRRSVLAPQRPPCVAALRGRRPIPWTEGAQQQRSAAQGTAVRFCAS